jgi:hypothetical protein
MHVCSIITQFKTVLTVLINERSTQHPQIALFLGLGLRLRIYDLERDYTYKKGIYFDLTVLDRKPVYVCVSLQYLHDANFKAAQS